MKLLRRTLLTFLVLSAIAFLFRGWIYRHIITYKIVGQRTLYTVHDQMLQRLIDSTSTIDLQHEPSVINLIEQSLKITSQTLDYTAAHNDNDPNKLIHSRHAHCVGYAAFTATTCNYAFQQHHIADDWIAKPVVGQLYVFGKNIHHYFHSPFFRDHDFVVIEHKKTGEKLYVDPTISDYLDIDFVSCQD